MALQLMSKQDLEKLIFGKFVKHAGLTRIHFESRDAPEPDILCKSKTGELYFELTNNSSQETQETIHTKNEDIKNKAYWFNPFPKTYQQKFAKHYKTGSLNCELVIYFSIQPVNELGEHFNYKLKKNLEWIRKNIHQSEFRKVWIYDYHNDKVLGCVQVST